MCGRYYPTADKSALQDVFKAVATGTAATYDPAYNISPHSIHLIVRQARDRPAARSSPCAGDLSAIEPKALVPPLPHTSPARIRSNEALSGANRFTNAAASSPRTGISNGCTEMQGIFPRREEDGSLRYYTYVVGEPAHGGRSSAGDRGGGVRAEVRLMPEPPPSTPDADTPDADTPDADTPDADTPGDRDERGSDVLSHADCHMLLDRSAGHVGHLGYVLDGRIVILPVNYMHGPTSCSASAPAQRSGRCPTSRP